jgi:peptide/nickel transport system permease protein
VVLCLSVTVISTVISLIIGMLSAVIGGWFDLVVQRIVDAWNCIPGMLLTVLMMSMFGNGIVQMILVMGIPAGISGSRMIRASAITVKDSGYVKMSEMMGSGVLWKSIRHVLPNILPIIITQAAGGLSGVIMMEASMNFLGFGVDVGTPSWGYMVTNQGRANMYSAPWLCLYPGFLISLMVLAANLFGDGLRDFMDPRLKNGVGTYNTKKTAKLSRKYLKKTARRQLKAQKGK